MDESLSDFQEKKYSCTGPKSTTNLKNKKPISRKPCKKIKGQKDIRVALKTKKNELINYSKEFDTVCKQSGVDVDPEHLQLAIALSNSLQDKELQNDSQSSESNSQSRISKIRSTLLQYGFKVPITKISTTGRKVRKHRKDYKLLTVSDSERLQVISDKYAQVLLENLDGTKISQEYIELDTSEVNLYNIATNAPYKYLRKNDVFYVNTLVEKTNSTGCLLRDWSEIPGRPASPTITEDCKMDITEIECSQEELDVVLSGTIKCSKAVFKSKETLKGVDKSINIDDDHSHDSSKHAFISDTSSKENCDVKTHEEPKLTHEEHKLYTLTQNRSNSPDIFDDELSIVDNTSDKIDIIIVNDKICTESQRSNHGNELMDLTECANMRTQDSKHEIILSQRYDVTKRKSNDFMELTECVVTTSQLIVGNTDSVDLTIGDNNNDGAINGGTVNVVETMDLTQSSDSSVDLPFVSLSQKPCDSLDDTIILNEEEYSGIAKHVAIPTRSEKECVEQNSNQTVFEEYVYDHSHSPVHSPSANSVQKTDNEYSNISCDQNIDLTQSSDSSVDTNNVSQNILTTKANISDNSKKYDISIDYDEMFDEVCQTANQMSQSSNKSLSESCTNSPTIDLSIEKRSQFSSDALSLSQNEVFEIADRELDYSMHKSRLEEPLDNFNLGGISIIDAYTNSSRTNTSIDGLPMVDVRQGVNKIQDKYTTPMKDVCERELSMKTPNNGDYIVKTDDVTPMPDYEAMSSPDRNKELGKYGLKPFKRKRAINLLTHLYNQTHPIAEPLSSEDMSSPSKKLKVDAKFKSPNTTPKKLKSPFKANEKSPKKVTSRPEDRECKENEFFYEVSNELPTIREVCCDEDDWVFQKREKAKVHSCRVPLHIAFHNYVSCRHALREAILRYQPINIDVVHKDLVLNGFRYDPKELLRFLDKKCITVKTADNNARNNRK